MNTRPCADNYSSVYAWQAIYLDMITFSISYFKPSETCVYIVGWHLFFAHVVTFFRLKERESHLLCKENQARKKMFLFWHTNQADLLVTQWTIARLKARLLFLSNREWTLWDVLKINTSVTLVRLTHFRSFVQNTKLRSFIHWRVQITEWWIDEYRIQV